MIVTEDKGNQFYQFLINAAGATEMYHRHDPAWRGPCKVTVSIEKDAWIC